VIVAGSLIVIVSLTVWSFRSINKIASSGYRTARETLKERTSDK
ncbi:hypothetical protein LCGC14_1962090, partial [marine sediment metagenome]